MIIQVPNILQIIFDDSALDLDEFQNTVTRIHQSDHSNCIKEIEIYLKQFKIDNITITKLCFGLLFQLEPNSSEHLFVIKWLKKLNEDDSKYYISNLIDSIVIYLKNFFTNDIDILSDIEVISKIFQNLTIIINGLKIDFKIDCLVNFVKFILQIHDNVQNGLKALINLSFKSDFYVKIVNYFENEFKLTNIILNKLFKHEDLSKIQLPENLMANYFQSMSIFLNEKEFPFAVIAEGCRSMLRALYLQKFKANIDVNQLSIDVWENISTLIQNDYQCLYPIVLLSIYLGEIPKTVDLFQLNIEDVISKFSNGSTNVNNQLIYAKSVLYLNWSKTLKVLTSNSLNHEKICANTFLIFNFVKYYWSYKCYENVFNIAKICFEILDRIMEKDNFINFINRNLIDKHSPLRFYCIIADSIGKERFKEDFANILKEYSLKKSLKLFVKGSCEELEFDCMPNNNITIGSNGERIIDLVLFLSLRINLMNQKQIKKEIMHLLKHDSNISLFFLKTILPRLLKLSSSKLLVENVLKNIFSEENNSNQINPQYMLIILQMNRQQNLRLLKNEKQFIEEFLEKFVLINFDYDYLLQSLSLLIESKKSTEIMTYSEMALIYRIFIRCEMIHQNYGRDQLIILFEKLLKRFIDSFNQTCKYNSNIEFCKYYRLFILAFIRHFFDNLHPAQYFGISLLYLKQIKSILKLLDSQQMENCLKNFIWNNFQNISVEKPQYWNSLFQMLEHDFDEIRNTTMDIFYLLKKLKLIELKHCTYVDMLNRFSEMNLNNIRPKFTKTGVTLTSFFVLIENNQTAENILQFIQQFIEKLNQRIISIKKNILNSAANSPTYPLLLTIRTILLKLIDMDNLKSSFTQNNKICLECKELFSKLIQSCMNACQCISSIVCNDSPEGHLPMDISQISMLTLEDEMQMQQLNITSQMLLFNAWMTVKESVIIISEIVSVFINHELDIFTCDVVQKVIDFLYDNQINLVHRGAFEQSSACFNKIIQQIWKNNCAICTGKIVDIINDVEQHLKNEKLNDGQCKLYNLITRRSAGLPFVVQAILANEPIVLNQEKSHLAKFIQTLVNILNTENKVKRYSWQIIHSLNILKALVQDSRFSQSIMFWIEELFKITLCWFNKNNYSNCLADYFETKFIYSIENSASMLLNALITRVFGVKRNRSDTSRKNRISSLLFFRSYPGLYSILYEQLEAANNNNVDRLSSIHSTLIILSKLTPSVSECNIFDANHFLPLIEKLIFNGTDAQIRRMSIETYLQLTPVNNYEKIIFSLYQHLEQINNYK